MPLDFQRIAGFDWDDGNQRKNAEKHGVGQVEAESVFFNEPLIVADDAKHSVDDMRFHALGTTSHGRLLHLSFTLRTDGTLIRIISARDMNRKERTIYEQA
jgi:uncharacterized protein